VSLGRVSLAMKGFNFLFGSSCGLWGCKLNESLAKSRVKDKGSVLW
jgi:hypothetical protein